MGEGSSAHYRPRWGTRTSQRVPAMREPYTPACEVAWRGSATVGPRLPKVSGSGEWEGGRTGVGEGVAGRGEGRCGHSVAWVNAAHFSHGKAASGSQEHSLRQEVSDLKSPSLFQQSRVFLGLRHPWKEAGPGACMSPPGSRPHAS